MPRTHTNITRKILELLKNDGTVPLGVFYGQMTGFGKKSVYDAVFRLREQGYVDLVSKNKSETLLLTSDGEALCNKYFPVRDGVWKIIIFDIPESKRKVRDFIRGRIKSLGFKRWQSSIWVSPYYLDTEVEKELRLLAEKYFVRLIKTTDINYLKDLEKLFIKKNSN